MKGIFLHSFSVHLWFLYSKVNDNCVLTLHPGTLMKVFINCASFLEVSLKHFMYKTKSYTKKDTYSLPSFFLFVFHWSLSVHCLIDLANSSSTILYRYEENRQLFLISNFSANALSLFPLDVDCWHIYDKVYPLYA